MNKLYFGDNLQIMREMEDGQVDLICTDPPFNSGRDYNAFLTDSLAQSKAFVDTWTWDDPAKDTRADIEARARTSDTYKALDTCLKGYDGVLQTAVSGNKGSMRAYLAFMGPRLAEMHRLLKDTGSIYLHCDPTASHYLKGVMDVIFEVENFRNEIVWHYGGPQRPSKHNFGKKHDTLFRYAKTEKYFANPDGIILLRKLSKKELSEYKQTEDGRYYYDLPRGSYTDESIKRLDSEGRIFWTKNGNPRVMYFLDEDEQGNIYRKKQLPDVWSDIPSLGEINTHEKLCYPTQKPITLYERLIKASSDANMLVMDPFCGCGTTIDAAHTLGRKWIGIDLTIIALDPMRQRLGDRHGLQPSIDYEIHGYPTNMQEVRLLVHDEKKYHDFSNWAVTRLGLQPTKSVGDGGRDGEGTVGHITLWNPEEGETTDTRIFAEVKSGKPTITQVRAFCDTMNEHDAIGIFITIEPVSSGMRQRAENMGTFTHNNVTYPRLQFWQITDEYFDNPDILKQIIRLPAQWIQPRRRSERHFDDEQLKLL